MKKILSALIVAAAALYGIIPVDAIPDLAPPVTYIDDLGVGLALLLLAAIVYLQGGSEDMSPKRYGMPPFDGNEGELNTQLPKAETVPEDAGEQRRPSLLAVGGAVTGAGKGAIGWLNRRSERTRGILLIALLTAIALLFVGRGGITAPAEPGPAVTPTNQAPAVSGATFTVERAGPTPTFDASKGYEPTEADKQVAAAAGPKYLVIPRVDAVINGSLDGSEQLATFFELTQVLGQPITENHGCGVAATEEGIYVFCVTYDQDRVMGQGEKLWQGDDLEVFLASREGTWTQVGFAVEAWAWHGTGTGGLDLPIASTKLEEGYQFTEIIVPLSLVGGQPTSTGIAGFVAVCISDTDDPNKPQERYWCYPGPEPPLRGALRNDFSSWAPFVVQTE